MTQKKDMSKKVERESLSKNETMITTTASFMQEAEEAPDSGLEDNSDMISADDLIACMTQKPHSKR